MEESEKEKKLAKLKEFIQKVDEIEAESFWQFYKQNGMKVETRFDDDLNMSYKNTLPNKESLKAFLLYFRQFFQNKDSLFIPKIHQYIQVLSATKNEKAAECFKLYKEALAQPYTPQTNQAPLGGVTAIDTIDDLIKIYLYGHYAHSDNELAKRYTEIQADDEGMQLHHFFFLTNMTAIFSEVLLPLRNEAKALVD